ncbi:cytochrome P450 [Glaciimonas sp. PAMC28666]|uniref:cytochrome P450 n=1 Tax=Glaciimonas sp. PAMC28666 TaxID=2807626 RepID=UPI0019640B83|nr:cytochrome P450 [Glaciimonas sp. PAMC28666]
MTIFYAIAPRNSDAEAHIFHPERWRGNSSSEYNSHNSKAFLPFGAGLRYCPGQRLAMLEIMMALAMLAKNFTVRSVPGLLPTQEHCAFTLCPTHVVVGLHRRQ